LSEIELVDSQINILLNMCYLKGKREFSVYSPLLGTDLFDVKLERRKWTCKPSYSRRRFKDKIESAKKKAPAYMEDEIPGYDALRNVIMAAGAFEDWEFGDDFLHILSRLKGNIGKYSICLDTNVLYNRFASSVLSPEFDERGFTHPPEIVMSHLVAEEIRKKSSKRYDGHEIDDLVDMGGDVFENFDNQYKLESRKAKIALTELDFISDEMRTIFHGDEEFIDDNEKRDLRIIKEYESSVEETGKKPLLLGFEYDFNQKVEGHDVDFIFMEYPKNLFNVEIGHKNLYKLLRYAAQVFGYVRLKGLGCGLLGVWDGMHDSEFEEGKVRVVGDMKEELDRNFEETINISNKLKRLIE